MLLLASGLVSVAMGQYDDAVSITVVSVRAVVVEHGQLVLFHIFVNLYCLF